MTTATRDYRTVKAASTRSRPIRAEDVIQDMHVKLQCIAQYASLQGELISETFYAACINRQRWQQDNSQSTSRTLGASIT